VHRLLPLEPDPRNRALLRLSCAAGLRVSELVALRWRDLQPHGGGEGAEGQVTVCRPARRRRRPGRARPVLGGLHHAYEPAA
jgi:integrase